MGKHEIFISHSPRDTEWAREFAQALEQRGLTVWLDDFDVRAGESAREALEAGLRSSDVLVAVFDPDAQASPNLFFELGAAIGMGKEIIPIIPKDLDPSALPFDVSRRHYLVRETPEQTAEELSNTLRAA